MLRAKAQDKTTELYVMDLLWLLVKANYDTEIKLPSEKYENYGKKPKKEPTAKEIIEEVTGKLKGG